MKARREYDLKTEKDKEHDDLDLRTREKAINKMVKEGQITEKKAAEMREEAAKEAAKEGKTAAATGEGAAAPAAAAPAGVAKDIQQYANKHTGGNVEGIPENLVNGSTAVGAAVAGAEAKAARGGAASKTTAVDKTSLGDVLAGVMVVRDDTSRIVDYLLDLETLTDNSSDIKDAVEEVGDIADAILSKLNGGVDFTQGFTSGAYATALKDSTLDSFRTALLEFAVIYAKMWDDEGFRKSLYTGGGEFMGIGGTMSDLVGHIGGENPILSATKEILGRKDFGDDRIAQTGLYYLQQGEAVISAADAKRGRVAAVTNNVIVNAAYMSPQELQHAVERGLYNAMRKT
jgi:hypothetical protein